MNRTRTADLPPVAKTIFSTDFGTSLKITLVEFSDGRLGILRNGDLLPPGPWTTDQLEDCIEAFRFICHRERAV